MKLSKMLAITAAATLWVAGLAAADVPAKADSPESEHLRLAHEVVQVTGVEANLSKVLHSILDEQLNKLEKSGPNTSKNIEETLTKYLEDRADGYIPELESAADKIYSEEFTDEQLSGIVTFFHSRIGKLYVEKYPKIVALISQELDSKGNRNTLTQAGVNEYISKLSKKMNEEISNDITKDDTKQMIDFLLSPAGQAIGAKRQDFIEKLIPVIQKFVQQLQHDRMERWCDLVHCTPRMRSWIDHPELMNTPREAAH